MKTEIQITDKMLREIVSEQVAEAIEELGYRDKVQTLFFEIADKLLREKLPALIDSVMQKTEFVIADGYNKTKVVTFEEKMIGVLLAYMNEEVNEKGQKPDYYSDKKMKRTDWLMRSAAEPVFNEHIRPKIANAVKEFEGQLRVITAERMQKEFTAAFGRVLNGK